MDVNRPQLCFIFILVTLKGTVSREAKFQKEHSHLTCACVAGTWTKRAKEKTGSARETTCIPRVLSCTYQSSKRLPRRLANSRLLALLGGRPGPRTTPGGLVFQMVLLDGSVCKKINHFVIPRLSLN